MSKRIKVLRNDNIFATHDLALNGLKEQLKTLTDGELCLASYGTSWDDSKTILGIKRKDNGITIIDTDGDSAAFMAQFTEAIKALDSEKTGVSSDNTVTVKVVEADGKISSVVVDTNDIAKASVLGLPTDDKTKDTAFGKIAKVVDGMKANNIPVGPEKETVTYPKEFDEKAKASNIIVNNDDTITKVIEKLEKQISSLTKDVIDNEYVISKVLREIINSSGLINVEENFTNDFSTENMFKIGLPKNDYTSGIDSLYDYVNKNRDSYVKIANNINDTLRRIDSDGGISSGYVEVFPKTDPRGFELHDRYFKLKLNLELDDSTNEMLTVSKQGLKLSNEWDCGTY